MNAGSSSVKFSLYSLPQSTAMRLDARGQIEGIGRAPRFSATNGNGAPLADRKLDRDAVQGAAAAIDSLVAWLHATYGGARVVGVGHRVVQGGQRFAEPVVITPDVLADLRKLVPLAPLHQPHNLEAIEAVSEHLPGVPQVACFDTSFHRHHPEVAALVPLPLNIRQSGVHRYGFHGLSYEYIASVLPDVAPDIAHGRVVVAHLGNGASLCAVRDLKSIDNTFGFTALDGLCMGTRPGALDPGVVLYLFQELGLSVNEVETILYEHSGLLGISGISGDMRDLLASTDRAARLAVDYFVYRATRELGGLVAILGGIDALVFTAGIGEHSAEIRQRICEAAAWMRIALDRDANKTHQTRISQTGSPVSVWVIPTNEELMIARHTKAALGV